MTPKDALNAAASYVRANPDELVRAAVNAATLRFGVPLAALRWLASQLLTGKRAPKDLSITSDPPALHLSAIVDAMGTPVRASGSIEVLAVDISPESVRITLRAYDVSLAMAGESDSPVATLIKSGALDLSKPGNLVKFLPKRPPVIVDAEGDRLVLDLLKAPKLASNPNFRRALAVASPLLGIRRIETDTSHLYVALKATPSGVFEAYDAFLNSRR